jgi:hypothetical protein
VYSETFHVVIHIPFVKLLSSLVFLAESHLSCSLSHGLFFTSIMSEFILYLSARLNLSLTYFWAVLEEPYLRILFCLIKITLKSVELLSFLPFSLIALLLILSKFPTVFL